LVHRPLTPHHKISNKISSFGIINYRPSLIDVFDFGLFERRREKIIRVLYRNGIKGKLDKFFGSQQVGNINGIKDFFWKNE
jgi:hypothetical protein